MRCKPTRNDDRDSLATGVARLGLAYILALVLLVTGLLVCVLKWLEHVPYRPPDDMSPLLGADELRAVRGLVVICSVMWCASFAGLVAICWPRRRGA